MTQENMLYALAIVGILFLGYYTIKFLRFVIRELFVKKVAKMINERLRLEHDLNLTSFQHANEAYYSLEKIEKRISNLEYAVIRKAAKTESLKK